MNEFAKISLSQISGATFYASPSSSSASLPEMQIPSAKAQRPRMNGLNSDIVARAIVTFCDEHGDFVTNLRLQRLLYYVQAWHLALRNEQLFPEDFQAWKSGPVEPVTYFKYVAFNSRPIVLPPANIEFPKKLMSHIVDVIEAYGSLSAFDLERLSKDEEPWKSANDSGMECPIIKKDLMKGYYKLKLLHGKE